MLPGHNNLTGYKECCAKSCSWCIRVHLKHFFENSVPISNNNSPNFVCVNFLKTRFSGCLAVNSILLWRPNMTSECKEPLRVRNSFRPSICESISQFLVTLILLYYTLYRWKELRWSWQLSQLIDSSNASPHNTYHDCYINMLFFRLYTSGEAHSHIRLGQQPFRRPQKEEKENRQPNTPSVSWKQYFTSFSPFLSQILTVDGDLL